jgi:hypothetical protein
MYVWQERRKAGPLERSPSNSLGRAGGGGLPVGVRETGVFGNDFGEDGGCCCCSKSCCICWNPFASCSICFCVSMYLAWESERACSRADIRSSLMIEMGSSGDVEA